MWSVYLSKHCSVDCIHCVNPFDSKARELCYTPCIVPFVLYSVNPVLSLRNLETGVYKSESKGVF